MGSPQWCRFLRSAAPLPHSLLRGEAALIEALEKVGPSLSLHISAKRVRIVATSEDPNLIVSAALDTV